MTGERRKRATLTIELLPLARHVGSVAGFAVGVGGLLADRLSDYQRLIFAIIACALVVVSMVASQALARRAEELKVEKDRIAASLKQLRADVAPLGVTGILSAIARALFGGASGWRVTVYLLEQDDRNEWWLRRIGRVSSTPKWEISGRTRFRVEHSLLRRMDESDLSNVNVPYTDQSGEFPDYEVSPDEWLKFQTQILRDPTVARRLTMKSRKYAWCAARESEGERRVVTLMAESTRGTGIAVDVLGSPLMPALLSMIARLSDLPSTLNRAVDRQAQDLGIVDLAGTDDNARS